MNSIFRRLQQAVKSSGIDAWVLFDFRKSNALAWSILELPDDAHCTRRWMIVVPATGECVKIVHRMERLPLSHLEIKEVIYDTAESWEQAVSSVIGQFTTIAMEYSPNGAIPVVSRVDAGTIDFVRSVGVDVVSSADLLQEFTAVLTQDQIVSNAITAGQLRSAVFSGFRYLRERLLSGSTVTEYDVQRHIHDVFRDHDLVTDSGPIVAIGPNAANPHYAPTHSQSSVIKNGDVVLIDAWAKKDAPGSIYADITWVGYAGEVVPDDVESAFRIIRDGRDAALNLVQQAFANGDDVRGCDVDDICRTTIAASGMGERFIHRTGHNIHSEVHGPGANMDNFETHDMRKIIRGTTFSIEPGLYIPNTLGIRTEIDVVIDIDGTVLVPSAPIQRAVLPLLSESWDVIES